LEYQGEGEHSTKDQKYDDRITIKFDSVELNKIFDEVINSGLVNFSDYGNSKNVKNHLAEAKNL
jgi:hypothetical protein